MLLNKTEETHIFERRVTKVPPALVGSLARLTVQFNYGHSAHQFVGMEPVYFPFWQAGDVLEIKLVRKRTTKTWLGSLLARVK